MIFRNLKLNDDYGLAVQRMEPVTLRGSKPITISLGLNVRIVAAQNLPGPFNVTITGYFYGLATLDSDEILTFHWTPDVVGNTEVSFPHLHVGRAIVSDATQVLPRTFHKVHVPTGFVSMPSVIRLAITEFGVRPLRSNWQNILNEAEATLTP